MSFWKKLLFSLLATVLFFALAEISLRIGYHPSVPFRFFAPHSESIVEQDPVLGYRLRANVRANAYASDVATNSHGFRGPEFDTQSNNRPRLVALGDSCTFGFGVSDNAHTYPAQLSGLLSSARIPAEVINAGVVGYSSYQALKLLETRLSSLHPDVLLIYIGWNDMGNSLLSDWSPTMTQDVHSESGPWSFRPYIVLALSDLLSPLRRPTISGFRPEAVFSYVENLRNIIRTAKREKIIPIMLTWPTRVQQQIRELENQKIMAGTAVTFRSWFEHYQRYQREIRIVATEENVHLVELDLALNQKDLSHYFDEIHLNDQGALEAARIIFRSIEGLVRSIT